MVVDISVDLPYRSLNYIRLLHIIYIYVSIIIAVIQLLIRNHGYIMVYLIYQNDLWEDPTSGFGVDWDARDIWLWVT